jgi:hypothetical protein
MKKNSKEIFESLQIDPITGQYFITIPEQIINELSWYEDSLIKISLEGSDLVLTENPELTNDI